MSTHSAVTEAPERDRKRRRGTIVKFSLAAIALFGIGAAATSAAWTDDAWFSASASAAKVELQGSLSPTAGFEDADTDAAGSIITIPATTFADIKPGEVRKVQVYVKNTSTIPIKVTAPVFTPVAPTAIVAPATAPANNIFAGAAPLTYKADLISTTVTPLAVGSVAQYEVTVTAPEWTNVHAAYYQGAGGTLKIAFSGTTAP